MMKTRSSACLMLLIGIGFSGCCDRDNIPNRIRALYSSEAKERNQAALDLARCGSDAKKAVPRLSELLYDENVGVQSGASYALDRIDTPEARAIMDDIKKRREAARKRSAY